MNTDADMPSPKSTEVEVAVADIDRCCKPEPNHRSQQRTDSASPRAPYRHIESSTANPTLPTGARLQSPPLSEESDSKISGSTKSSELRRHQTLDNNPSTYLRLQIGYPPISGSIPCQARAPILTFRWSDHCATAPSFSSASAIGATLGSNLACNSTPGSDNDHNKDVLTLQSLTLLRSGDLCLERLCRSFLGLHCFRSGGEHPFSERRPHQNLHEIFQVFIWQLGLYLGLDLNVLVQLRKQVMLSLDAASLAEEDACLGICNASAEQSQNYYFCYPDLPSHPGHHIAIGRHLEHHIAKRQMTGFGGWLVLSMMEPTARW